MKRCDLFHFAGLLLLSFALVACGEGQNVLGLSVTKKEKKADIAYQIFQAEYYYDRGKFAKALTFAEAARAMDPNNEHAGLLAGAIEFGLAGMDIYSLATRLMAQGEQKQAAGSDASSGATSGAAAGGDALAQMSTLFGLSAADIQAMTLDDNRVTTADGKVVLGAPSSGIFKDYPVLLPKTASAARLSGGETIQHLAKAVMIICRFVGDDVKMTTPPSVDARDVSAECQTTPYHLVQQGKSRFLWALAHLVEALAFRSIVLYAPSGGVPNIEQRSKAMSGSLAITDYISGIGDLSAVLGVIFPVDPATNADSMLNAMITDLEAVDRTFSFMPGLPASLTSSVRKAIEQVQSQKAKATLPGGASGGANANVGALKEQLTSKLSANLRDQITAKSASGAFSPQQQTDACAAYKAISATPLDACITP